MSTTQNFSSEAAAETWLNSNVTSTNTSSIATYIDGAKHGVLFGHWKTSGLGGSVVIVKSGEFEDDIVDGYEWDGETLKLKSGSTVLTSISDIKANLSLDNVDNTSDADKPVSTAQQSALDLKADKAELADYAKSADVTAALADKADQQDLVDGLAAKADTADLATYARSSDVASTYATKSALATERARIDTLQAGVITSSERAKLGSLAEITSVDASDFEIEGGVLRYTGSSGGGVTEDRVVEIVDDLRQRAKAEQISDKKRGFNVEKWKDADPFLSFKIVKRHEKIAIRWNGNKTVEIDGQSIDAAYPDDVFILVKKRFKRHGKHHDDAYTFSLNSGHSAEIYFNKAANNDELLETGTFCELELFVSRLSDLTLQRRYKIRVDFAGTEQQPGDFISFVSKTMALFDAETEVGGQSLSTNPDVQPYY
ncbi:hypothetical protein [Pseudovibrio sp. SPO723]|uniref:hypothetical protein n=1 Tax=Nesiotobacter zosterae TaxID=392721 RepID=UPI0029C1CFEE|nr:hypothetical protein [Pseudovibrio sp. SPO723]MDX5592558.1 hypothetical protein [Pseudovibrio sp. SPO723]